MKDQLEISNRQDDVDGKLAAITAIEMMALLENKHTATWKSIGLQLKIVKPSDSANVKGNCTKQLRRRCKELDINIDRAGRLAQGISTISAEDDDTMDSRDLRERKKSVCYDEGNDEPTICFFKLPGKKRKLPNATIGRGTYYHVRGFYYHGIPEMEYDEAFAHIDGVIEWYLETDAIDTNTYACAWETPPVKSESNQRIK